MIFLVRLVGVCDLIGYGGIAHRSIINCHMYVLFHLYNNDLCVRGSLFLFLFKLGVFCCNVATMVSLCSLNELVISFQVLKKLALFAVLLRRIFF